MAKNTQKANLNSKENLNLKRHLTLRAAHVCAYHCAELSYTAQNSSDNLPSYPPDNHHQSCLLGRGYIKLHILYQKNKQVL